MGSGPTCTGAVFHYKVLMTDGTALPAFLQFDSTSLKMTWPSVDGTNAGTYNLKINGYLDNGQYHTKTFSLIFSSSCNTAVLTPSVIKDQVYLVQAYLTPMQILIPNFTSTADLGACGAINY